ncbi:nucleotidyl transferase AbiEii/AbiGii toxin family protein [Fannyhessea vaginae]|uniref:nucleotidyl transferase AbiEii/AbiGii toxin family protein n=1 Tax=Fannyhessea vaginae TaxID=82135 RepID=UPI003B21BB7F
MGREYGTKWIFFITSKGYDASCKSKCSDSSVLEDDIRTYPIDTLAQMKMTAFMSRDRIRDLYDVSFITNNYWEELSQPIHRLYGTGFSEKGIEQFDLMCATQNDDLIDKEVLAESFLKALDKAKIAHTTEKIHPYRSLAEELAQAKAAPKAAVNRQKENNDTSMQHGIKH